jgi:hypothetical protein
VVANFSACRDPLPLRDRVGGVWNLIVVDGEHHRHVVRRRDEHLPHEGGHAGSVDHRERRLAGGLRVAVRHGAQRALFKSLNDVHVGLVHQGIEERTDGR